VKVTDLIILYELVSDHFMDPRKSHGDMEISRWFMKSQSDWQVNSSPVV